MYRRSIIFKSDNDLCDAVKVTYRNLDVTEMIDHAKKILNFLLIIEYLNIYAFAYGPSINYCLLRCPGARPVEHTVCKRRHQCGPEGNCTEILPDENFRRHVLHQHNEIRNLIANGSDIGPYGNTGAKSMQALSYDMELEYIAGCSTNTCSKPEADWCNDSERFKVSSNRAWGKSDNWTCRAVPVFYRRIKFITDARQIHEYTPFPQNQKYRESFLRLVWAETKYVGCSGATQKTGTLETTLKCIYGPADYVKGKPVYKMAANPREIASECWNGRNRKYTALCGKIDPIPKGKMWTMFKYES